MDRYYEGALVAAMVQVCESGEIDGTYANDDEFIALILSLMGRWSEGAGDPRYNAGHICAILAVLRSLDDEVRRIVFRDRERSRRFARLIVEGVDITDEVFAVAVELA